MKIFNKSLISNLRNETPAPSYLKFVLCTCKYLSGRAIETILAIGQYLSLSPGGPYRLGDTGNSIFMLVLLIDIF